jgi:hypothetical protein
MTGNDNEISAVIDRVAKEVDAQGLTKFISDTEYVAELAKLLSDELRVPPALTKLVLKLAVPILVRGGAKSAKWVTEVGAGAVVKRLAGLPGARRVLEGVENQLNRLSKDAAAKHKFDSVLAARREGRMHDVKEGSDSLDTAELSLSRDLRADLEILASLDEVKKIQFEQVDRVESAVNSLIAQLTAQPPLRLRQLPLSEQTRFIYGSRSTRLVGRDQELQAIHEFLEAPRAFQWWVITGPGGMGKSRLALEVGLRYGVVARVGFLRAPWNFDWDNWQPDRPTVVIIDYAESLEQDAREMLLRLSERTDLPFAVRVILLARHAVEEESDLADGRTDPRSLWLTRLLGSGTNRALLLQNRFAPPLELTRLDDESLWSIIVSLWKSGSDHPAKDAIVQELARIDGERRPLYAALVGDALNRGADIRNWDRFQLLENIRREETEFWDRIGVSEDERELLMLMTMVGGLTQAEAADRARELVGIDLRRVEATRYARVTGAQSTLRFDPLEPDILGEFFVLDRLRPRDANEWRAWKAARVAGDISYWGLNIFLQRAAADFPDHPTVREWLRKPPEEIAGVNQRLGVLLSVENGRVLANQLEPLREVHAAIKVLYEDTPDMMGVRDALVVATGNLSLTEGSFGNFEEAYQAYVELARLCDADPANEAIRDWRARVASDLTIDLATAADQGRALALLEEYAKLSAAHPAESILRDTWSRSAYHYLHTSGKAIGKNSSRPILRRLIRAASEHPTEIGIAVRAARAARNLLIDYFGEPEAGFKGADVNACMELYEELRSLVRRFPSVGEIRAQYQMAAEAVYNLSLARGDTVRAARILREAHQLS